jgi:glycosyltransferase involved in cell wall biosynthesis
MTSAHHLGDERILYRMALTLDKYDYDSSIIATHDKDETNLKVQTNKLNLQLAGSGKRNSNLADRLHHLPNLTIIAFKSNHKVIQIHDPDLLLIAPILKLSGKRVVYDVHDDYETSILVRLSEKPLLGWLVSKLWWFFEHNISRMFDGIVVADRHLASKFEGLNPVILGNFPRLNFTPAADTSAETTFNIIYVGGVDRGRGIDKVLDALELLPYEDIRFHVVGECKDKMLLERLKTNPRVVCYGRVAWTDLYKYYTHVHVGVALYQPIPSFLYCPGENSVKIIEYMAAGIPVVCSDFPGLRGFVEDAGYGLTVQPDNPAAISEKIRYLYEHPDVSARMGQNGRHAFETEYNWEKHEGKLITLYERILGEKSPKYLAGAN